MNGRTEQDIINYGRKPSLAGIWFMVLPTATRVEDRLQVRCVPNEGQMFSMSIDDFKAEYPHHIAKLDKAAWGMSSPEIEL